MKKFVYGAIAAIAVAVVALVVVWLCQRGDKPTVNECIVKDYEAALEISPRARYYETECVLNGCLDDVHTDAKIVSYSQIVQIGDSVYYYNRDFKEGTLDVTHKYGHWGGTFKCDPHDICITFDEALDILDKSNIVLPHSNKMTLRCPMGAGSYTPLYIFGSTTSKLYVYVDAVTGKVGQLNSK